MRHLCFNDPSQWRQLDIQRMPKPSHLIVLLALAATACSPFASEDTEPEVLVCREQDRTILVDEKLTPKTPSTAFTVPADEQIWVGLIVDPGSSSWLFSEVSGMYVLDEGEPVEFTYNNLNRLITDDEYLDYDRQGQYMLFDMPPGGYQLWSKGGPEIAVVSCGAPD